MSSLGTNGETLLRCTNSSFFAVGGIVVGFFLMVVFAISASQKSAQSSSTDLSFLLLVGAGMFVVGLVLFFRPIVFLEANRSGIMLYANTSRMTISQSITEDLFIPWDRIESIRFLDTQQVRAAGLWLVTGGMAAYPLVVLRIQRDFTWPPLSSLRVGLRNTRPDEIYLNADWGSVRGTSLYKQLEELRSTYSSPRPFGGHN